MNYYYKYSDYLHKKYGCKVYKIPVNLPLSCPVRDSSKASSGCAFCGEDATGYECKPSTVGVKEQIAENIAYISRKYAAQKFDIYFQNYTNTYTFPKNFESYVKQALENADNTVRLTVSTRPDCVAHDYLKILKCYSDEYGIDICIELGLQSVNVNTLKLLKRKHNLSQYIDSVGKIKDYGFEICTHIITTLPWDTNEDVIEAARLLSVLKTDSVKMHTLYIEKNTVLAEMYANSEFQLLSLEDYIQRTVLFIEHLSPTIAIQRLNARVPKENSIFANWNRSHWVLDDLVIERLKECDSYQGKSCDHFSEEAVTKFL